MTHKSRFEIVHTSDGWTARFRASNGRVIMSSGSQVYARRRGAENAIAAITGMPIDWIDGKAFAYLSRGPALEVREVDER